MEFKAQLVMAEDAPRTAYQNNNATASFEHPLLKGLHYGQRKLMLSEVEFFCAIVQRFCQSGTPAADKKVLIVYAGAACGLHLPFLFSMFTDFEFVLVDPAPFCSEVHEIAAREDSCVHELIEGYCTAELCLRIRRAYCDTHHIFLVSDIRSGQPTGMQQNQEHTAMMQQDNAMQREWCFALEVQAAMLKFHPPYPAKQDPNASTSAPADTTAEEYVYLAGTALWGVWAPKSSSEVRLVVEGPFTKSFQAPNRTYSCTGHEEQCYAYNIDHRYAKDCSAERTILQDYLSLFPGSFDSAEALSATLSERLAFPLFRPLDPDFTEQHARWVSLLYSSGKPAALKFFEPLKDAMTVQAVAALVTDHKAAAEIPAGVTVGGVELPREFWFAMASADFAGVYGFPAFRWTWWRPPAHKRPPGGQQPKFAGKKRHVR